MIVYESGLGCRGVLQERVPCLCRRILGGKQLVAVRNVGSEQELCTLALVHDGGSCILSSSSSCVVVVVILKQNKKTNNSVLFSSLFRPNRF